MDFFEYLFPRLLPNCVGHVSAIRSSSHSLEAYPDIITLLDEYKWQASLLIRQTNPNFTVHQKPMMQIYDWFARPSARSGSSMSFLAR